MDIGPIFEDKQSGGADAVAPDDPQAADIRVAQYLAAAATGDASACFDLGVVFSTSGQGVSGDLIEAHKWFNLAAVAGHDCAKTCRADIAGEMTSREIAEAQRRAREWIAAASRHPAQRRCRHY